MIRTFLFLMTLLATLPAAHASPVPGGVYTVPAPEGATSATYDGRPVLMSDGIAYVGIGIKTTPGTKTVTFDNGETRSFEVETKAYPEQHLTIQNRKMVNPDPESLARIRAESQRMRSEYLRFTADRTPSSIMKPVEGITSSLFGFRRVLNGQPRNPHSGLDIAAPTGTPIASAADGVVTITGDFYFNGKTVFVDHGQGLITMYCHLSEISVQEGDELTQGDILGLVGATGRVTGPHLHWSVSMNGYRVDPELVMALLPVEATQPEAAQK